MTPTTTPWTITSRSLMRSGCIDSLAGCGLALWRDDLDGPALVVGAPDVAFALEIGEVLMYRRQGLESELARDFLEAGGVPLLFDMLGDVIEDLALAPRYRHVGSRIYTET